MLRARLTVVVVAVAMALAWVGPASAEWRFDLFTGVSITPDTWIEIDANITPLGGQRLRGKDEIHANTSPNVGGRVGYWFESPKWLGAAFDVLHWRPNLPDQPAPKLTRASLLSGVEPIHIQATAVGFSVMARAPGMFPSPEAPQGQLEPYVMLGPAAFVARLEDRGNLVPEGQSTIGLFPGFMAGGGVLWKFSKNLGLFSEYRFTRFTLEFSDQDFSRTAFGGIPAQVEGHAHVLSHHILFGLSFRY